VPTMGANPIVLKPLAHRLQLCSYFGGNECRESREITKELNPALRHSEAGLSKPLAHRLKCAFLLTTDIGSEKESQVVAVTGGPAIFEDSLL